MSTNQRGLQMPSKFDDLAPVIVFVCISFALICTAIRAYTLSSKAKAQAEQRRGSWIAALVSSLVGLFATVIYAIPVLEDFNNPQLRFRDALLDAVIVWAICAGIWVVAARCVISALRNGPAFQRQ
jgi:cytochrome bd-type quinol oxidase subunit 2